MKYVDVIIEVEPLLREGVENRMFELGAEGVREESDSRLIACLPEETWARARPELDVFLNSLSKNFPNAAPVNYETRPVPDADWAEKWKEFYRPAPLGEHFYLVPCWERETPIPEDRIALYMEPGQAFGTGLHESTRLCVELLEKATAQGLLKAEHHLIDVGTGTGILAVVAHHLGVEQIEALDIDPLAVEASEENFKLNATQSIRVYEGELSPSGAPFDFIVSNILLNVHLELVPVYRARLRAGGGLILAGLLGEQQSIIGAALEQHGFRIECVRKKGEWLGILAIKK